MFLTNGHKSEWVDKCKASRKIMISSSCYFFPSASDSQMTVFCWKDESQMVKAWQPSVDSSVTFLPSRSLFDFSKASRWSWILCNLSATRGISSILSFSCAEIGIAAKDHHSQGEPFGDRSKWLSDGGIGPKEFSRQTFSSWGNAASHLFSM